MKRSFELHEHLSMDKIIKELKESPSESRVNELILKVLNEEKEKWIVPNSQSLDLFATLINEIVPNFDGLSSLKDVFSCLPGISSIVGRILALGDIVEKNGGDRVALSHINLLCSFLISIIDDGDILISLFTHQGEVGNGNGSRVFNGEILSLFAGSKLFESLSMANHYINQYDHLLSKDELKRFAIWNTFSIGKEYTRFLVKQVYSLYKKEKKFSSELLERLLKLGFPIVISEEMMVKSRFELFLNIFKGMRGSSKWYMIESSIIPYFQERYLSGIGTIDTNSIIIALSKLLSTLLSCCNSPPTFKYAESIKLNFNTRQVLVQSSFISNKSHFNNQFNLLLQSWGNQLSVNHTPEIIQEAQTQILILSLNYFDKEYLEQMTLSREYTEAISNRLSALTDRIRFFGMIFAEQLSKKADISKPLKFGLDDIYDEDIKNWLSKVEASKVDVGIVNNDTIDDSVWKELEGINEQIINPMKQLDIRGGSGNGINLNNSNRKNESIHNVTTVTTNDTLTMDSDDDPEFKPYPLPDYDEEDSDDDPNLAQKNKPTPPVYIKDLLSYLQEEDYNKNHLALIHGAELIRKKSTFGQEVDVYAEILASQLAGMKDTFDMEKFNENRLIVLSTLVAACPTIVPTYLSSLIFSSDYSLQQRINILSSISLGARELSGLKPADDYKISSTPAKLLPPEVHKLFISRNDNLLTNDASSTPPPPALEIIDEITSDLQNELLQTTSQKAKDELIGGPKVLRISSKLQHQRNNPNASSTQTTTNKYAKLASRYFFSPLITEWYSHGGIQSIGTYSDILASHFIKTLALLLHASYPSSPDIPLMTGELLDLLLNQRTASLSSIPILESLLTGLLIILETSAGDFLITRFSRQIVELKLWLEDTWQTIPNEKTQTFAASILYKLTDLLTKFEQHLLGEFTSLEGTM